tara:strand:+ start:16868 stop:17530 length:663 start_codon:yes stop_codon:yes gene_type:complete
MIIVFDMDETLYDEFTYVKDSLNAVALYLSLKYTINLDRLKSELLYEIKINGRGKTFDNVLKKNSIFSKKELNNCISVYRKNTPKINIYDSAKLVLEKLSSSAKYLVSDGNKLVQNNKVKALDISKYFKKIFLTHNYGRDHAKPSTYCFKIIKNLENCSWNEMVYIGDDPTKDFVALNPLGVQTIRIHKGRLKDLKPGKKFDAKYHIKDIYEVINLMKRF